MKGKIKNYQIQTRLGSGSYGVIFKAINKVDKSECVLKQIRMNKMSQKAKKSTLNQATIMGKLIHPFIVQYKQSFVQDDTLHIIMEYCNNGDLSMYLKMQNKKPLKQQKIWKFFLQICLGLEYIHKNKILHRDIKTLNIFLNKNQDVKIGDLGVAKMLQANDFAQTVVGTPFYLSPQLCQQKPYNQKSDIWAMGCLLYELCTFKHPFEAANQASLILKIIRGKYSPIPQFYSKDLKDMIDMCLERDYKRRPTASMILQRPKIKELIDAFKLQQKIKQEYQKIKTNKQNNKPQLSQNNANNQVSKPVNKPNDQKNVIEVKNIPQIVQEKNVNKKLSQQKKPSPFLQKKPTVSGMPQKNIILPDKQKIIQKLQPANLLHQQKKEPVIPTPQHVSVKQIENQKKMKQNKEEFLKNLQRAVENHNFALKKSPPKKITKYQSQEISTSAIIQHKSRLQKIDNKIQEQLKRQHQLQKQKLLNERKKSETPNLSVKSQQKTPSLVGQRKSVPSLVPKQSNKQPSRYQKVNAVNSSNNKITQNPLIPPLPPKMNKEQVIKVKMDQPSVGPKVYDKITTNDTKNKGIIKSKGFSQQLHQESSSIIMKSNDKRSDFNHKLRKSSQNIVKPVLFGLDQQQKQRIQNNKQNSSNKNVSQHIPKQIAHQYLSQRNIKADPQLNGSQSRIQQNNQNSKKEPQRYLFKKKPQQKQLGSVIISNNRIRKGSSSNQLSRNAKNVSKYSQVTKQDQDCVMNLPDSLRNQSDSSDEERDTHHKKDIKMNKKFQLKQINNDLVLQKYEQILSSKSISDSYGSKSKISAQKQAQSQESLLQESNQSLAHVQQQKPLRINKNLNQYDEQAYKNSPNRSMKKSSNKQYYHPQQKVTDQDIQKILNSNKNYQNTSPNKTELKSNSLNQSPKYQTQNQDQQYIEENQSLALKSYRYNQDEEDQILDESGDAYCQQIQIQQTQHKNNSDIEEEIYEVNKFNLDASNSYESFNKKRNQKQDKIKEDQDQQNLDANTQLYNQSKSQWSFDQQPELPMLDQKESPYFQEANPYLIAQQQEQTIQQKRNYLQIRLQQNIKRQDQINKLMQIKIQQCKAMINPKFFEQILQFFRKMLKKEDQYTQNDDNQVDNFLRKKGLTDQRKFQNIYKIMHFEMELQNTRKIIQRVCKKLSQLEDTMS